MQITILGAGCIGGLVGAALQACGKTVTFVDRGEQLQALQSSGLTIQQPGEPPRTVPVRAVGHTSGCGIQDVVFLALKAHHIESALENLEPLVGSKTVVVTLQNGIPWWYFQRHGGEFDGRTIEAADPRGRISAAIDPGRIVGCVAYPAVSRVAPGHILHAEGSRFPVGAPDGSDSDEARLISGLFTEAGFKSPVLPDIRAEIWLKAIGNMSLNPISALTQATLVDICEHDDVRTLTRRMMEEGEAVAAALGKSLRVSVDRRIEGARRVGKHRSSMLQDVECGEPLELEALVGAVTELGALTATPTPTTENVLALARLLNEVMTEEDVAIVRRPRGKH